MVVEISKSGGMERNPGCRDDRAGRLYVDGWERKCTSKARIRYRNQEILRALPDTYPFIPTSDRPFPSARAPLAPILLGAVLATEPVGGEPGGRE